MSPSAANLSSNALDRLIRTSPSPPFPPGTTCFSHFGVACCRVAWTSSIKASSSEATSPPKAITAAKCAICSTNMHEPRGRQSEPAPGTLVPRFHDTATWLVWAFRLATNKRSLKREITPTPSEVEAAWFGGAGYVDVVHPLTKCTSVVAKVSTNADMYNENPRFTVCLKTSERTARSNRHRG